MKHGVEFHMGGGLFSHWLILLENIRIWLANSQISPTDELYINSIYKTAKNDFANGEYDKAKIENGLGFATCNVFDHLLDQNILNINRNICTTAMHFSGRASDVNHYKGVYTDEVFSKGFLKLNPNLMLKADAFMAQHFKENMLGVHVRMTDMNMYAIPHDSKPISYDDYCKKIEEVLKTEKIDKIFVASDNQESLNKLSERFDICYHSFKNIASTESNCYHITFTPLEHSENMSNHTSWNKMPAKTFDENIYVNAMIDAVLLANCHSFIGRKSALSYSSRFFPFCKLNKFHYLDKDAPRF